MNQKSSRPLNHKLPKLIPPGMLGKWRGQRHFAQEPIKIKTPSNVHNGKQHEVESAMNYPRTSKKPEIFMLFFL